MGFVEVMNAKYHIWCILLHERPQLEEIKSHSEQINKIMTNPRPEGTAAVLELVSKWFHITKWFDQNFMIF